MNEGSDIPVRALGIFLAVVVGLLGVWFGVLDPAFDEHTRDEREARRAGCGVVDEALASALTTSFGDLDGRVVRSMRSRLGEDGTLFVTADLARPDVANGFTGDLATWRVVPADGFVRIEAVDRNARDLSAFDDAPAGVDVTAPGGLDSRWCAKDAALHPRP